MSKQERVIAVPWAYDLISDPNREPDGFVDTPYRTLGVPGIIATRPIHRTPTGLEADSNSWTLTHKPTGRIFSSATYRSLAAARRTAHALAPLADWPTVTAHDKAEWSKHRRAVVREILLREADCRPDKPHEHCLHRRTRRVVEDFGSFKDVWVECCKCDYTEGAR